MMRSILFIIALVFAPSLASAQQAPANTVYAGPTTGSAATPSFRALVANDLPITVNSQSTSYTIAATDCNGVVVETGAFQTITLPASLTGFPASCPVRVVNGSTTRGQKLSNFPGLTNLFGSSPGLWPNQSVLVGISGGAWVLLQPASPWQNPSGLTLFADSGSGSDNNDCLASGASACATLSKTTTLACTIFTSVQAISFTGTMSNYLWGGCGSPRLLQITGTGGATINDGSSPGVAVECDDTCVMQMTSVTIAPTHANSFNVQAQRGGIIDIFSSTLTTGAGTGGYMVVVQDHGNINFDNTSTWAGGAGTTIGSFLLATRNGSIVLNAPQTVTGTWTTTQDTCLATKGGIDVIGPGFSGGTVTGTRFGAVVGGGVDGTPNTNCPGNANGTAVSPGWSN